MRIAHWLVTGITLLTAGVSVLARSERPGLLKSGEYREAEGGGAASLEPTAEDVYAVGPYLTTYPNLPRTEGIDTVEVYCQICHSNTYITMQPPLPAATWEAEVKKMMETHGASIPDEAVQEILTYLKANFTPETRKR